MASKSKSRGGAGRPSSGAGKGAYSDFGDDKSAIDDWAGREYSGFSSTIKGVEQKAIDSYVNSGYLGINDGLRNDKFYTEAAEKNAGILRKVIDRSSVPSNVVVYRGFDNGKAGYVFEKGGVITDKAFSSTTLHRTTATHFGLSVSDKVLMRIRVPRGSKGLYTNATKTKKKRIEREMLLQAGSRYRIRGVKKVDGVTHLDVDLLP